MRHPLPRVLAPVPDALTALLYLSAWIAPGELEPEHVKQLMGEAYHASLFEPYTLELVHRAQALKPWSQGLARSRPFGTAIASDSAPQRPSSTRAPGNPSAI